MSSSNHTIYFLKKFKNLKDKLDIKNLIMREKFYSKFTRQAMNYDSPKQIVDTYRPLLNSMWKMLKSSNQSQVLDLSKY